MNQKKKLSRKVISYALALVMVFSTLTGIVPGMSMTVQAATTLTDTFVSSTGQTEYIGNYSKVTCGETKDLGIVYKVDKPIIIETLNGEIIDKIVLKSPATNEANHYVYPDHGTVTNEYYKGHAILGDDLLITITNVNATKVNITYGTYTYPSTAYYDTVQVYCHSTAVDVAGIELNKTSTALTVGETETLTATVSPDDATDKTITWSSDNTAVATVSDGVVTAVSAGTANITVTATNGNDDKNDDKTATCTVTVKKLEEAETKEVADTDAAKKVTDAINALPASDKVATTDKAAIEAARKAYDALTADQKAKVPADTLKKLEAAEKALAAAEKKATDDAKKSEGKNEWIDGQWYGADGNTEYKAKGSWKQNDKGWWYEDTDGWYPVSQWQKIDGKLYYFTADGYMDYSEYRDGYWLGSDGAWDETYSGGHWMQDSTGWWYVDATGWYPVNRYLWVDGVQYWFNANGYWE